MGDLSMNQIIHAAVRRDLARTETALRGFPDGDGARAARLRTAWGNLVRELTHHHEAEDEVFWPLLRERGVDPVLLAEMESEHVAMKRALADVSAALESLVATPTSEVARTTADVVRDAGVVIGGHLDHEERDIEGPMADMSQDPELRAAGRKARPASLVDAANALAWMQDGAGERERSSLTSHIPAPVVAMLTRVVARRYRREVAPVWR